MASAYDKNYELRYESQWLQRRMEVSVLKSAQVIGTEPPNTPDHAKRVKWATWANQNSSVATIPFMWPAAFNASVVAQEEAVSDAVIDEVVAGALTAVINDFAATHP